MINSGWMPIESAPRDGARVLLYLGDGKQCVARTEHHPLLGTQWVIYGDLGKHDCWVLADDCNPTHWMPLPAAPKMEDKEKLEEALKVIYDTNWDDDHELWDGFFEKHGCQPHHVLQDTCEKYILLQKMENVK